MADKALVLRIDLAYVPWDARADEFGHGEPAALLKLLELARGTGLKFHFFASGPSLRAFPAAAEAVLGEGHHLDWLCLNPADERQAAGAFERFTLAGNPVKGAALEDAWPEGLSPVWLKDLGFLTGKPGTAPAGLRFFPVEAPSDLKAVRDSGTLRHWDEAVKSQMGSLPDGGIAIADIHPQVLAKHDPSLRLVQALAEFAVAEKISVRTLRDLAKD